MTYNSIALYYRDAQTGEPIASVDAMRSQNARNLQMQNQYVDVVVENNWYTLDWSYIFLHSYYSLEYSNCWS